MSTDALLVKFPVGSFVTYVRAAPTWVLKVTAAEWSAERGARYTLEPWCTTSLIRITAVHNPVPPHDVPEEELALASKEMFLYEARKQYEKAEGDFREQQARADLAKEQLSRFATGVRVLDSMDKTEFEACLRTII